MATFWGNVAPPADGMLFEGTLTAEGTLAADTPAAVGDVYVQGAAGIQHRWNGSAWVVIPATENRGDVLLLGGAVNQRLAKLGGQAFRANWQSAAAGVMQMWNQTTPEPEWIVNHGLTAMMVDVTVITPGYSTLIATQGRIDQPPGTIQLEEQTVLVPEIIYTGNNLVTLAFVEPVAGTAIVRR